MEQILEKVMNFINENTMLLIIICIFLIVILVIYLIDNTIKTKKLEQEELEKKEEPKILESNIPEEEVAPVVEEVAPVVTETAEVVEEPKVEEVPAEEPVVETPVAPVAPVDDYNIDELLNKDYSANNEIVNNMPATPVVETPKSKYTNDKKLSDIFGTKKANKLENTQDFADEIERVLKEQNNAKTLETTKDFSDELDRILKKLSAENTNVNDSQIEETNDYTNMF